MPNRVASKKPVPTWGDPVLDRAFGPPTLKENNLNPRRGQRSYTASAKPRAKPRRWTAAEDSALRAAFATAPSYRGWSAVAAAVPGRSVIAVRDRATRLGLPPIAAPRRPTIEGENRPGRVGPIGPIGPVDPEKRPLRKCKW